MTVVDLDGQAERLEKEADTLRNATAPPYSTLTLSLFTSPTSIGEKITYIILWALVSNSRD